MASELEDLWINGKFPLGNEELIDTNTSDLDKIIITTHIQYDVKNLPSLIKVIS